MRHLTHFNLLLGAYQELPAIHETGDENSHEFILSPRSQLDQVLRAADSALHADPTFREAWEVYRWEFLNEPYLVGRVFPVGVILEQRLLAGQNCGEEIDVLFANYAENHFHYFDQPSAQPPDCDLLGLMLRLAGHSNDVDRCRKLLETPLSRLMNNLAEDGLQPTFLTNGIDPWDGRKYMPQMTGQRCAAVQSGLLLGLLLFDSDRFAKIILQSAQATFEKVLKA